MNRFGAFTLPDGRVSCDPAGRRFAVAGRWPGREHWSVYLRTADANVATSALLDKQWFSTDTQPAETLLIDTETMTPVMPIE